MCQNCYDGDSSSISSFEQDRDEEETAPSETSMANGTNNSHDDCTHIHDNNEDAKVLSWKIVGLERQGSAWIDHKSKLSDDELRDDKKVKAEYWPEVEELVRSLCPAATSVRVYDSSIRLSILPPTPETQDLATAVALLHQLYPAEAAVLCQKRFRKVSVWRPIPDIEYETLVSLQFDSKLVEGGDMAMRLAAMPQLVLEEEEYKSGLEKIRVGVEVKAFVFYEEEGVELLEKMEA